MPELQLFDYRDMWNAIKPFAIPVVIWFIFAVIVTVFIAVLKHRPLKTFIAALMFILIVSLIFFILVGLGAM